MVKQEKIWAQPQFPWWRDVSNWTIANLKWATVSNGTVLLFASLPNPCVYFDHTHLGFSRQSAQLSTECLWCWCPHLRQSVLSFLVTATALWLDARGVLGVCECVGVCDLGNVVKHQLVSWSKKYVLVWMILCQTFSHWHKQFGLVETNECMHESEWAPGWWTHNGLNWGHMCFACLSVCI